MEREGKGKEGNSRRERHVSPPSRHTGATHNHQTFSRGRSSCKSLHLRSLYSKFNLNLLSLLPSGIVDKVIKEYMICVSRAHTRANLCPRLTPRFDFIHARAERVGWNTSAMLARETLMRSSRNLATSFPMALLVVV